MYSCPQGIRLMRRLLDYVQATTTFKPITVPATGGILVCCHRLLI